MRIMSQGVAVDSASPGFSFYSHSRGLDGMECEFDENKLLILNSFAM